MAQHTYIDTKILCLLKLLMLIFVVVWFPFFIFLFCCFHTYLSIMKNNGNKITTNPETMFKNVQKLFNFKRDTRVKLYLKDNYHGK